MPSSPISPCPSCPPHAAGGHGCAVYSSSVTDAEWAILEPLLPAPGSTAGRGGRPEKHCRRVIVDAIPYLVRGGIAWRQLPVEFPPAGTVYAVFARWARSGAWQRILDALRDRLRVRAGRDRCPTAAIIDSQTVPAADTVPRSSRGWEGPNRSSARANHNHCACRCADFGFRDAPRRIPRSAPTVAVISGREAGREGPHAAHPGAVGGAAGHPGATSRAQHRVILIRQIW